MISISHTQYMYYVYILKHTHILINIQHTPMYIISAELRDLNTSKKC